MADRAHRAHGRRRRPPRAGSWLLLLLVLVLLLAAPPAVAPTPPAGAAPPGASPGGLAVPAPGPDRWPTYRGSIDRSGFTASDGPSAPTVGWERVLSAQPGLHLRTSPAIEGDLLVVADDLGGVYALNLSDNGRRLWSATVGPIPTAPTLDGAKILLGDGYGDVYALNATDNGSTLWQDTFPSPIVGALAVDNGTAYAATYDGHVLALATNNGAVVWQRATGLTVAGAIAKDGAALYVAGASGALWALDPATGATVWTTSVAATVRTGPVAAGGSVFLTEYAGRLDAFWASNGTERWSFDDAGPVGAGPIEAPPAVDGTSAYLVSSSGGVFAVDRANGTLRWASSTPYPYRLGYNLTSAPVITPTGLYLVDALERVAEVDPSNGTFLWSYTVGTSVYSSAAVTEGALAIGTDQDALLYFATPSTAARWPVDLAVVDPNGSAVPNGTITLAPGGPIHLGPTGTATVELENGTYGVEATAPAYRSNSTHLIVSGPTAARFVLMPVPLYPVTGRVADLGSFRPLAALTVRLHSADFGVQVHTVTDAAGGFVLHAPAGANVLEVLPSSDHDGVSLTIEVPSAPVAGVELLVAPFSLARPAPAYTGPVAVALLTLGALTAAGLAMGYWSAAARRRDRGLSGAVLSAFGRFVLMRGLLVGVQALLLLAVLFFFGSFLPAAGQHRPPCSVSGGLCAGGSWQDPAEVLTAFVGGWWSFVVNMFSGHWGVAAFGQLTRPVTDFIGWWIMPSVELALFGLLFSALLAYPIGLRAGWRPDGWFDQGARLGGLLILLLPTFLLVVLALSGLYQGFVDRLGDTPYGILPTTVWFNDHGGQPSWIGIAANTGPTGLPLVDAVGHGAWSIAEIVLVKTLLQAAIIAFVYVGIFLRFARHAIVERAQSMPILAARARGVPEHTLLWRHAGREVIPVYFLIFGITLPMYIGTQAVVEALFSDVGLGRVLIVEMLRIQQSGFGFASTAQGPTGNLYQVTIFLLLLIVLIASLCSDILTHYLDPRLQRGGR